MITSRFQSAWIIWVLFTRAGKTGEAWLQSSSFSWEGVESEVFRGYPGWLGVQRKRAHLFHWLSQKNKKVSISARSLWQKIFPRSFDLTWTTCPPKIKLGGWIWDALT